jgi:hypothetical protein
MSYTYMQEIYLHAPEEQVRFIEFYQSHHQFDFSIRICTNILKIFAENYIQQFQSLKKDNKKKSKN